MSMMSLKADKDHIFDRKYKICYYTDYTKFKTGIFENTLVNVDDTYFWFSSLEFGLTVIRQDMVVYMGCIGSEVK